MHTSTKNNLLIASCYAGVLALGMAVGPKFKKESSSVKTDSYMQFMSGGGGDKVEQVLRIIRENYVDPVKVDTLQNLAITQILSHLDPHSSYLPPVKARQQSQDLQGNYTGIGIEYTILKDTMLVTSVKNGPALAAGIKAGDKVLRINDKKITGDSVESEQIVSLIKGRQGTTVQLQVKTRDNLLRTVSVVRDKITVSSIDAAYMLNSTIGYIKISKFGARTDEDFAAEVGRLKKQHMSGLVLDLRHNGGGYLNAATALADEFLKEKQLIVYTQGEHEPRTDYFATNSGNFESGKLVVLVDETTASASEVVAGAIQDLDRGKVIGRRSFGKGLVQEQFNFGDGSALNLTIARYYTPLGRSIQRPYKMSPEQYFSEASTRLQKKEVNADGSINDSVYDKSHSFRTASGHTLYGGGGIMPDVYIPVDTSSFNSFFYDLRAKGLLTEFLFTDILKGYKPDSFDELRYLKISDGQYRKLVQKAIKSGIKISEKGADVAREAVNSELRASAAKVYFGEEAYFKVLNDSDKAIIRALQEFR